MNQAEEKFFFNPISGEELIKMAKEIVEKETPFKVWEKSAPKETEKLIPILFDPSKNILFLDSIRLFFHSPKSSFVGKDVMLLAPVRKNFLMGKTNLHFEIGQKVHYIKLGEGVYFKGQTREALRIETKLFPETEFSVKYKKNSYSMIDFSIGGLKLAWPKEQAKEIKTDQILENITICIGPEEIKIPYSKVVKLIPDGGDEFKNNVLVAITFEKIDFNKELHLNQLINLVYQVKYKKK